MTIKISAKGIELTEKEIWELEKLLGDYEIKINRKLKHEVSLAVKVKTYEKCKNEKCGKKKYSLNVKIENSVIFKSDSNDYDLARAIHKAMDKIMSEIEHRFHVSNQNKK